jgi:hypothetical protein
VGLTAKIALLAGIEPKRAGLAQLISTKDSGAFVQALLGQDVGILGIEGFHVNGNQIVPDMDAIADFSGLPQDEEFNATTVEEARKFLRSISDPDMYFEFLLRE